MGVETQISRCATAILIAPLAPISLTAWVNGLVLMDNLV